MRKGWIKGTLGSVCEIQSGAGFPDKFQGQVGQKFPFYKVSDMNLPGNENFMVSENNSVSDAVRKHLHARIFPKGSVIFPKVGGAIATNKKRRVLKDCCVDNNVMGLIPKPEYIDADYLFYFLSGINIYEFSNKAALPSIRQSTVDAWEIKYPLLIDEQRRIVAILDEMFEGISSAAVKAEKNLVNANMLFKSYLRAVFTQPGDEWPERKLGDLCGFVRGPFGGSLKKSIFVADGYAVYEQQHAIYDQFDEVRYFINEAKFREMKRFELAANDLIMSCSGTMGRVAIVPKGIKRGIINQALLKLNSERQSLSQISKTLDGE